jgi:hypothetical protein
VNILGGLAYRFRKGGRPLALLLMLCPGIGVQAGFPGPDEEFCASAQSELAQIQLSVQNHLHQHYESFVDSKASAEPLVTQQFFSNPVPGHKDMNTVVSCKMKTADSIAEANRLSPGDFLAADDRGCDYLTRKLLYSTLASSEAGDLQLTEAEVVVDPEELTFMGPSWLKSWPFQAAHKDEAGVVHLTSRALYVPWSVFIPAPAAFKGVYYCHMVAPAYLHALLKGELEAPPEL